MNAQSVDVRFLKNIGIQPQDAATTENAKVLQNSDGGMQQNVAIQQKAQAENAAVMGVPFS